ncbi:MAG: tyrosine-type recombinase/integrase [Coprococcus sp.]|nr:tyrosine-type recombinase/integrase [Coprococcus sp.]
MARNYSKQVDEHNIMLLRNILRELPQYVTIAFRGLENTTSTRTRLGYARDVKIFFDYLCENNPYFKNKTPMDIKTDDLSRLEAEDIEEFLDAMRLYTKNGRTYTNGEQALKRKLSALRVFFAYLYKNNRITSNAVEKVDMPKIHEKQIIRMEPNEVANFLDSVEYGSNLSGRQKKFHEKNMKRDLALMSLMLSTGMRVSECVGIDINDVDFDNMRIRIIRKGGKEAYVYFSDEAEGPLSDYLEERKKLIPKNGHEDALFLSGQLKRISVRSVENIVEKYSSTSVPLKHITPHKLRSTFGTELYRATDDIYLVADVLGHSDVNTTRKHYADMDEERKRAHRNEVKLREKRKNNL